MTLSGSFFFMGKEVRAVDWKRLHRIGIWALSVAGALWFFLNVIMPLAITGFTKELADVTFALMNAGIHFQTYAFAPGHLLGEAAFLLCCLLFVLIAVVGTPAFVLLLKNTSLPPTTASPILNNVPDLGYYDFLRRFIRSVNGLNFYAPVPDHVLHELVSLIRLFEAQVIAIIGMENIGACRMLWIVREEDEEEQSRVLARKPNRLFPNEERIVNYCFETSSKAWDFAADVRNDPKFFAFPKAERMQAVMFAHNSENNIGFVLAIDQRRVLTDEVRLYLEFHIASLIHLWDLDIMRRVMLELGEEHWEEVGS